MSGSCVGETLIKVEPTTVKWEVKLVQKWNLTLATPPPTPLQSNTGEYSIRDYQQIQQIWIINLLLLLLKSDEHESIIFILK